MRKKEKQLYKGEKSKLELFFRDVFLFINAFLKNKIFSIFVLQTSIISAISLGMSFVLSHCALYYINNISTGYGIVINPYKIYQNEYVVLVIMFAVTLLPVLMYISKFFKKDISKI